MRSLVLSAIAGLALALTPAAALAGDHEGGKNPCNPCASNPCNPCAANPCNPCAGKANPCNPCAGKAANPCNPCAGKAHNPCKGKKHPKSN